MHRLGLSIVCAAFAIAAVPAKADPRTGAPSPAGSGVVVATRDTPRFFEPATRCGAPYYKALHDIHSRLGRRLANLSSFLGSPSRDLPGRWLVPDAPGRRSGGFVGEKFVDGDRQCANLVRRAGRIRCMKWEPLTYDPVVEAQRPVVPEPTPEELETYVLLAPWVVSRGAGPEFRYEGRFVWATTKLADDFAAYIGQPEHPALCSGAQQVIEVFARKAKGLKERIAEVNATVGTVQQQAMARLQQLRAVAAAQPRNTQRDAKPGTDAGEPAARTVAVSGEDTAAIPEVSEEPRDLSQWIDIVASLAMTPEQADDTRAAAKPLDKLQRALGYLRPNERTPVPRELRAEGIATLRAAEAKFYADVMAARFREVDEVLFGSIDGARQAYTANCTCGD